MQPRLVTYTGRFVNPLALRVEDISIEDIAHSLSLCNRFNGHSVSPISVAQHSVFVSWMCDDPKQGLLHDGAEAYLGDITKWLKHSEVMAGYREAEERAQRVVFEAFGCSEVMSESVKRADDFMVRAEAELGFPGVDFFAGISDRYPRMSQKEYSAIQHWRFVDWRQAKQMFLRRFEELTK